MHADAGLTQVGGIIMLGLMVSSIHNFAKELGASHVIRGHAEKRRTQVLDQSTTNEQEFQRIQRQATAQDPLHAVISTPFNQHKLHTNLEFDAATSQPKQQRKHVRYRMQRLRKVASRKPKCQLLKEEKDRFEAMRTIQRSTHKFKRYSALAMSVFACKPPLSLITEAYSCLAVGLLWCGGAVGFWKAESKSQHLSNFQALYFCYVSLLTIGYGDLSPRSNAGKPFFIVWSLIAVPTMTILISDMGDTVIASFKRGTFKLADWTVLPKAGVWRDFCEMHPWLERFVQRQEKKRAEKEAGNRVVDGFHTGPAEEEADAPGPTLEDVALLDTMDDTALARKLSLAIRRVATNISTQPQKRYTYEEWARCTRLIRFTRLNKEDLVDVEEDLGMVEWDWIGEDSPMLAHKTESEWMLDRLCESLNRYLFKLHLPARRNEDGSGGEENEQAEEKAG